MTVTHLTVELIDKDGNQISRKVQPVDEAVDAIVNFVELHGTDPDEDGKDAARGSINFWPSTDREIARAATNR